MPRLAVVIPLYNHADYIIPALQSVFGQTRQPDRVIVVDDGSTDHSVRVVEDLRHPQVELIRQENQGAHNALNRGVREAADCDYIAILNSDDLYEPTRLAQALEAMIAQPSAELLCTGLHLIDEQGLPLPQTSPKVRRMLKIRELVLAATDPLIPLGISNYAKTTSNFVVRREFLLAHPFPPYRYVHDYHLMLTAALAGKLALLPDDLLAYRTHATNTIKSGGKSAVMLETLQMNLDLLAAHAEELRTSPELRLRWRHYLQKLFGNHTDFRGELFIQLLAGLLADHPEFITPESLKSLGDAPEFSRRADPLPTSL